ncbi:hypothetical protein P886_4204 [Alteromonadaceae bacterium 2753L.S.0a.02]|nr:hypothetical protein P886_4204 [Alteromonadaceae bacterium 2753L.S.0a.02]
MTITIQTLGEFTLYRNGESVGLPKSKRTRALLAYLAVTNKPHRRERLCDLLWEMPDDPRGSLRWSLSKIRPLVNEPSMERLVANRDNVGLEKSDVVVDINTLEKKINNNNLSLVLLVARHRKLCADMNSAFATATRCKYIRVCSAPFHEKNMTQGKANSHGDVAFDPVFCKSTTHKLRLTR